MARRNIFAHRIGLFTAAQGLASMSAKASCLRLLIKQHIRLVQLTLPKFISHLRTGNWSAIFYIQKKMLWKLLNLFMAPIGLLLAFVMRIVRPWFLIRINILTSERIGHFAANPELYLCERDANINTPTGRYIDLWYHNWPVCNWQLAIMWSRVLHVGPRWLLSSVAWVNSFIPNSEIYRVGENTQGDVDVHNLLDRFPPHLSFLPEEELQGESGLRELGIPDGTPFICLLVRDSSYLKKTLPWRSWDYHDYRDCDIQNYILAAQKLADRGYYVIRMGVVVKEAMDVDHPMIIDYAANEMRSDFMDIYLGAKCAFCISNGSGFDAIPVAFRRPILFVDIVPLGLIPTSSSSFLFTVKKYWLRDEERFMTFREVLESRIDHLTVASNYNDLGIDLLESSPEEIAAVTLEMEERLRGVWETVEDDEELQHKFWALFTKDKWHGEIYSRIGSDFLRRQRDWLV